MINKEHESACSLLVAKRLGVGWGAGGLGVVPVDKTEVGVEVGEALRSSNGNRQSLPETEDIADA